MDVGTILIATALGTAGASCCSGCSACACATPASSTSTGASASRRSRSSPARSAAAHAWRKLLVTGLTALWGVRLGGYLFWRNAGHGEDYRYQAMRRQHGARFPLVSLYGVRPAGALDVDRLAAGPARAGAAGARPPDRARRRRRAALGDRRRASRASATAAGALQGRPGQRGRGDGPRPVALHPPPQLLRRRLRVVGPVARSPPPPARGGRCSARR